MTEGRKIIIREIPTPLTGDFNIDSIINTVFGQEDQKTFSGSIERQSYTVTRRQFERDLKAWALKLERLNTRSKKIIEEKKASKAEYLRAIIVQCFLKNDGSTSAYVTEYQKDPHAAMFNYDIEVKRIRIIQNLLIKEWSKISAASEEENHIWIFDVDDSGRGHSHAPVVVSKFEENLRAEDDNKITLEFIMLGCGNAIGQRFLSEKETHHVLSNEELVSRLSKSNDINDAENFRENALSWLVQYTSGKLVFKPRFVLTKEQYQNLKSSY